MPVRGAELARALSALVAKFSSQADASDQPPDDIAGVTSCYSIGDDSNKSNRGSVKQHSKQKRRQMKRVQATGGLYKPEENLFVELTKLLKLASEDKLHPGREKHQIVWTNLLLTPRIKNLPMQTRRRERSRNLCVILRPSSCTALGWETHDSRSSLKRLRQLPCSFSARLTL